MTKEEAIEVYNGLINTKIKEAFEFFVPELKRSEDEGIRKALLEMVHDTTGDSLWVDYNVHKEDALAWLEKRGEQKPAWSEEDETKIKSIIAFLKSPSLCAMDGNKGIIDESIKYLKSIKDRVQPQSQWKPSERQIYLLNWVANILLKDDGIVEKETAKELQQLLEQLKKLRED